VKDGGLLTPHEWDLGTVGRTKKGSRAENVEAVVPFEAPDYPEFALVGLVGIQRPIPGHVDETHTLKTEELEVGGTMEFSGEDGPDGTGLANKIGPIKDWRKSEAVATFTTGREGRARANTLDVIHGFAGSEAVEAVVGKGEIEQRFGGLTEAVAATGADSPLVPDATLRGRERESSPNCHDWRGCAGEGRGREQ
jgi:hypothetical protein